MKLDLVLAWLALLLWATLAAAAQGALGHGGWLGRATPDLCAILCLALAARVDKRDLDRVWITCALGRAAVSAEAPLAILSGMAVLVLPVRWMRSVVDLRAPLARALLAGVGCLFLEVWSAWVLRERTLAALGAVPAVAEAWSSRAGWFAGGGWARALASTAAALLLGGALASLPGLRSLQRRKTWAPADSWR